MPVHRNTPENKRRARTGCLPCRKRRRKCDERKPKCRACEARDAHCEYPGFTFVTETSAQAQSSRAAAASNSPQPDIGETPLIREISPNGDSETLVIEDSDEPPSTTILPVLQHHETLPTPVSINSQTNWENYFLANHVSPARNETARLLYFRYRLVPWIDSDAPGSSFGDAIMALAHDNLLVLRSIVALSSYHQGVTGDCANSPTTDAPDFTQVLSKVHDTQDRLIGDVCSSLLALPAFFACSPTKWSACRFPAFDNTNPPISAISDEPVATLSRLHLKYDLGASILNETPPIWKHAPHFGTPNYDFIQPSPLQGMYDSLLSKLAQVLRLVYHDWREVAPSTDLASPSSLPGDVSQLWTTWSSLWATCAQWYQERPPTMQPVLDFGRIEASQIDTESASAFPMPIYSSAIALQANACVSISCIILLSVKPRLLTLPRHPSWLTSQSWHKSQIAGSVIWNNFSAQWDPVVIAGLLLIARDMTHPSQQQALEACFDDIRVKLGINLDEDIQKLRDRWQTFRHGGLVAD